MVTTNSSTSKNLREEVAIDVVKGTSLENTINELFNNFESGEQRNVELVNKFFNQGFFTGEESLIDKLIEIDPTIDFDKIKDEGINLAVLQYENLNYDFKLLLDNTRDEIKTSIKQSIHDKIKANLTNPTTGALIPPYGDFPVTVPPGTNVLGYFQDIIDYLKSKESGAGGGKKTIEILKEVTITNADINGYLPGGLAIAGTTTLSDPSIPTDLKESFDKLLSFEIGKEASRTLNIINDTASKIESLFSNSIPAINTIITESSEYKYDEKNLGHEYEQKLQLLNNNKNISEQEKKNQINDLKWQYYIIYLKSKNKKVGEALQKLYENNFNYKKLDDITLKNYLNEVANIRLKMLFDSGVKDFIKLDYGNLDEFSEFYKELADPSTTSFNLKKVNKLGGVIGDINIPVKKTIKEGENTRLKNIEQYRGKEKAYDVFPINYEIKKDDINTAMNEITIEDKTKLLKFLSKFDQGDKYVIEGGEVGKLIYLFFVINSSPNIINFDLEHQKDVVTLFGKPKPTKHSEEKEKTNNEKIKEFKNDIEKRGLGKFEIGSEIRVPFGNSELPGGGNQWMKVKITNINDRNGTFTGEFYGGELKFDNSIEGKAKVFKMDLDDADRKKLVGLSKDPNRNIRLLPDPKCSDFTTYKNSIIGKTGKLSLKLPEGTTWDGNKFTHKVKDSNGKEEIKQVKKFGAFGDDKTTYNVEYNPIKRHFIVTSTFIGNEKSKNGKTEKKRFSYSREMDWNNFLIFSTQKRLVPQTEEEAQDTIIRQQQEFKMLNGGKWKLNWFSITNIKNVFKTLKGNIKKKIDDYNKAQDSKLEDILIGDWGIYSKLSKVLGFIPSMKEGLGELEQEYYNDRDNRTRKKIEQYLKVFQADPDFGTTFDQIPPHAKIQGGRSLQQIVLNRVRNAKDRMGDPGIYQAAALLLANFEKGGSPYRGLSTEENTGLWVRALLGKAHYEQFMRDKAACIRDRDLAESSKNSGLDKKGLNEALANCEMDYIINNIRGSYGKLPYFGCHEARGINGDNTTNYIDNPSKRLLSDQFANKLESASRGRFNKSTVEEAYGKNKNCNKFEVMEDEFSKMSSSRYQKGAGALRRMFDLASDEALKKRAKRHFLTYLLSGALDINCDPGLKKQVYGWAKPMSFVPGMLVKEAGVAENIAILLDDATKGDFSKNVTKYFHRSGQLNSGPDFKELQKEINKWLTDNMMDELDKYFANLPTKDFSGYNEPQKSILEKFKKSLLEEDVEEFDRGLLDNPTIVNNGLLTNLNVVTDRLRIEDGEFKGKDSDDINNKKLFWIDIQKAISKRNAYDEKDVNFVLNKYFNRFGLNSSQDRQETYKWIKTAYHRKGGIGKTINYNYKGKMLNMGKISNTEIQDIVWYTFKGKVMKDHFSARKLPLELDQALDEFQKFFQEAFNNGTLQNPGVESDAFKAGGMRIDIMPLGSNTLYKDVMAGDNEYLIDDGIGDDDFGDEKQQRKARRTAFKTGGFINHEMAQIERSFKNRLPTSAYRPITQNISFNVDEMIELI